MTLLKELINIPERVHQGDFVLKLADGVDHAEQTLRDYVVTPQLVECFDNALGFIRSAVESASSKAAYLHGSFGAGKSHFMAVLNLLLAGNSQARSITELADVVARHNSWTEARRFLLVPYHMIGAHNMESAILGQYAEFVRRRHAQAPVPGFYLAEGLFRDAQRMRERDGDESFFGKLNEGTDGSSGGGASGWGALGGSWDAQGFEAAMLEPPGGEERARLVGDLISQFFSAYASVAEGRSEAFVPLDDGLAIMSRHARALGYDAVILFLDELVLWLASRAADVSFVSSEGTKLVKLVEATHADRPIPLVSFVARQRDLRDLVGENLAGSLQMQFSDVLKHWEARFHKITLEDRNLPAIAEKRVLRPKSEAARSQLQAEFEAFLNVRKDVLETLLTSTSDRGMFRKVYPFSPALVQTLIAVSAALQRERTALKLMLQLLVDRRDDLELGQLIPVGDLWDVLDQNDEPFSDTMRIHFANASRLYTQRLLPLLERQHGVTWESLKLGQADAARARYLRNDARLVKTLLLGALVPEVESLKALTALRLAALNHGSFRSPIPGREAQDILRKCRDWAAEVGEIKVTDDANPLVSVQVTGVDIEPIVRGAEAQDNPGNRRRKVRELLFEQLGVPDTSELYTRYEFKWRGTRREVELVYENVREMSDDRLKGRADSWTVVVDFPFDEPNRSPADDIARLNEYRGGETRSLVCIPAFLSDKAARDLGRLVILDYILQGERFDTYAGHLALVDRAQAKALARNQRDQLLHKMRACLDVCYGISSQPADAVAAMLSPEDQFRSLDPTLEPRPPVGATLKQAFEALLGQLFLHQFPAHPEFDTEVRPPVVRKVWAEVQRALESADGRSLVADTSTRKLVRSLVPACLIGRTSETHLLVERHWHTHFAQQQAREGGALLTVGQLRRWIDVPRAMGLPVEVQNLVILTFAGLTNRRFIHKGGPITPTIDSLPDELELREQALPALADWETAITRAGRLFGLTVPQTLNAANVGLLVDGVRGKARELRDPVAKLVAALRDKLAAYPSAGARQDRLTTAQSAQALLAAVLGADEAHLVQAIAAAAISTSEAALSQTLARAVLHEEALRTASWDIFAAMGRLSDHRAQPAMRLLAQLGETLGADEYVTPLAGGLRSLQQQAVELLAQPAPPLSTPEATAAAAFSAQKVLAPASASMPPSAPRSMPVSAQSAVLVEEASASDLDAAHADQVFEGLRAKVRNDDSLRLTLTWRLQRRGASS